jgi:putative two-component system response regulator
MAEKGKILFICDDTEVSRYLEEQLIAEGGYSVVTQESLSMGLSSFSGDNFDLVIIKLDSAEPLEANSIKEFKRIDKDSIIIVLLDEAKPDLQEYLFSFGVYDFIIKPINLEKLLFLVRKGLELRSLILVNRKFIQGLQESKQSLQKQNTVLAKRIEDSTRNLTRLYEDLRVTYMRTIKVLAQAIEARDPYTHSHSENVAKYATIIASEMGLSAKEIETIRQACELHDLGKIGIGDSILMKPGTLTKEEWVEIRKHPVIGATILEPLTFLSDVIELVRQHHEHYDGSGYPDGKKGEEISLGARIINLADAYEAMRSARSYRKIPLSKEAAIEEIRNNSGTQFDPKVVEVFFRVVDKL